MPEPTEEKSQGLDVYAEDVTLMSSHTKTKIAIKNAQQYLDVMIAWMEKHNLILADKTQATLLTTDQAEQKHNLILKIKGEPIETTPNPKILGLTFDTMLYFGEHVKRIEGKAKETLEIVKARSGTSWVQHKETLVSQHVQDVHLASHRVRLGSLGTHRQRNERCEAAQCRTQRCAAPQSTPRNRTQTTITQKPKFLTRIPIAYHMRMTTAQFRESARYPDHPMHHTISAPEPDKDEEDGLRPLILPDGARMRHTQRSR